jgi:hypothetical protein
MAGQNLGALPKKRAGKITRKNNIIGAAFRNEEGASCIPLKGIVQRKIDSSIANKILKDLTWKDALLK